MADTCDIIDMQVQDISPWSSIEGSATKEISYTFARNQWKSTEITRNQAKSPEKSVEIL